MSWTVCLVRPMLNRDTDWSLALSEFCETINAWLTVNRTGSTNIKAMSQGRPFILGNPGVIGGMPYFRIKFRKRRDAVLFKMFFGEYVFSEDNNPNYDRIILPLIRRVMPNIIAHEIVGVSPMSAPVGSIFSMPVQAKGRALRPRYSRMKTARVVRRKYHMPRNPLFKKAKVGISRKQAIMEKVLFNTEKELKRWNR